MSSGRSSEGRPAPRELAFLILSDLDTKDSQGREAALNDFVEHPAAALEALGVGGDDSHETVLDGGLRRNALRLVTYWLESAQRLDDKIQAVSQRWRLDRLDRAERSLLRLAVVELDLGTAPPKVIAAEGARLANRYGSERSARFVNGVTSSLIADAKSGAPTGEQDG